MRVRFANMANEAVWLFSVTNLENDKFNPFEIKFISPTQLRIKEI